MAGRKQILTKRPLGYTVPLIDLDGKRRRQVIFDGTVAAGATFTFQGQDANGTMGPEIEILVDGSSHTTIHTSCSQPIGPGLVRGDFTVMSGKSRLVVSKRFRLKSLTP